MMRFTLAAVLLPALVGAASNDSSSVNKCIVEHMLARYSDSSELTLANMERLFDAVTTGYHDKYPAHSGAQPTQIKVRILTI